MENRQSLGELLQEVANERARQDLVWGEGNPLYQDVKTGLAVLMEEVGELAKAALDEDLGNLRVEAIQVAAVAVAIAERLTHRPPEAPTTVAMGRTAHLSADA